MKTICKLIVLVALNFFICSCGFETQVEKINVYTSDTIGEVNPLLFGTNFIGYDPATYEPDAQSVTVYSNYGGGIWDPEGEKSVSEVITLAKEAGITISRFPGGSGTHGYDWKKTIGDSTKRSRFLYGLDEFLSSCEDIGCEAVITVSYFTGTAADAADLVEYLNGSDGIVKLDDSINWAHLRVLNGHPEPYGIKYFEFGNEVYAGNQRAVEKVEGREYGERFIEYSKAMKAVDHTILIGAPVSNPYPRHGDWNRDMIEMAGEYIDFLIPHTYHTYIRYQKLKKKPEKRDVNLAFRKVLGTIDNVGNFYKKLGKLFEQITGRNNIPLAITEYNGGFIQQKPVPYRHSLGTALFNAGLLQIFMEPQNNIFMANYWQFCNSYWGMIYTKDNFVEHDYRKPINYIKRPNYYVYKLYKEHFRNKLINVKVKTNSTKVITTTMPFLHLVTNLSVNASISKDGNKIYLMVLNKNMDENITANIDLKEFDAYGKGNAWVLNGPGVDATNEENPDNVKIIHKEFEVKGSRLQFTFEPHSLTAIEIR